VLCVFLQARQLSELLDFAEQERQMLLEKETSLQQELDQVGRIGLAGGLLQATGTSAVQNAANMIDTAATCLWAASHAMAIDRCNSVQHMCLCCAFVLQLRSRAVAAEGGASDALAESAALEQQLDATKREVRPALLVMKSL
jgi:hypothetical protein